MYPEGLFAWPRGREKQRWKIARSLESRGYSGAMKVPERDAPCKMALPWGTAFFAA